MGAIERRSVQGRPGSLILYSHGDILTHPGCPHCPHLTWSGNFFTRDPFPYRDDTPNLGFRGHRSCCCQLREVLQASPWVSRVPLQLFLFPGRFGLDEGHQENLVLAGAGIRRGPRRKGWSPEDATSSGFVLLCLSDLVSIPHYVVFLSREVPTPRKEPCFLR